jgi:hypothetical protein
MVSMIGMTFDSVGGLYLAYDLLGGNNGPLCRLTRIVNYSILYFLIFLLGFNLKFALIGSIGLGTATAFHMQRISHKKPETLGFIFFVSLLRGLAIYWATTCVLSHTAAIFAGCGLFIASFILSRSKLSLSVWYKPGVKPTITLYKLFFSIIIGCCVAGALAIGEYFGHDPLSLFAACRTAVVISLCIMSITIFGPGIEWFADNVPDKRMGYIGAVLFLLGFVIQAIPSLLILLHG